MASADGLVPITRAFLAKFYDQFPFPPLSEDVARLTQELRNGYRDIATGPDDGFLIEKLNFLPPHKIDENLWRNREQIEEILHLLDKNNWPMKLKVQATSPDTGIAASVERLVADLQGLLNDIQSFQSASSEKVFKMVVTYMPQDFRGTILKQHRERSERKRQAEVEALISSGANINEKYSLLWKQQMERRRQLAQLGNASGVYKTVMKYLVGVPEVLLDFVRQLNDHNGPMEEQRQRYGPPLYQLTSMATAIHIYLKLCWRHYDEKHLVYKDIGKLLHHSVSAYSSEFKRFVNFFGGIFDKSPFLISSAEAGAAESIQHDEFKETLIPAGKIHEVILPVNSENCFIAWEFTLTSGKDVGFSLELLRESGEKSPIIPYQRIESNQGTLCTPVAGNYKLIWDNSYSTFFKKGLRYKVDLIPPVAEITQTDMESVDER